MLADTATGALIGAGATLAGSLLTVLVYWLGRRIPTDVSAFAAQSAGTLDGISQALAAIDRGDEDAARQASNVTVYLGESERLLGAARLHLRGRGEETADRFIVALRTAEQQVLSAERDRRDDTRTAARAAYADALVRQREFGRAAQKSRR